MYRRVFGVTRRSVCTSRVVSLPVTSLSCHKIKSNLDAVIVTEFDLIHIVNNGLLNSLSCNKRSRIIFFLRD